MANSKSTGVLPLSSPKKTRLPQSVSSIMSKSLREKIERLSAIIDDTIESGALCTNSAVASMECKLKNDVNDSNDTQDTAANSSVGQEEGEHKEEGGTNHSFLLPPSPEKGNFASWLSSQEFDSSAIVWNGDDANPQDLSAALAEDAALTTTVPSMCVCVEEEEGNRGCSSDKENGCDYTPLSDPGKKWPSILPEAVSDAWNTLASINWQCWQQGKAVLSAPPQPPKPGNSEIGENEETSTNKSKLDGTNFYESERRQQGVSEPASNIFQKVKPAFKESKGHIDASTSPHSDNQVTRGNYNQHPAATLTTPLSTDQSSIATSLIGEDILDLHSISASNNNSSCDKNVALLQITRNS